MRTLLATLGLPTTALALALATGACGSTANGASSGDDGGTSSGGGGVCSQCASTSDCASGESCVQLGGDNYCAPACSGSCGSGASCTGATTFDGQSAQVCVPAGECAGGNDGGTGSSSGTASSSG